MSTVFVDTSVLIASENVSDRALYEATLGWLDWLWRTRTGRTGNQALTSFTTRSPRLPTPCPRVTPGLPSTPLPDMDAVEDRCRHAGDRMGRAGRHALVFGDCLAVACAQHSGCSHMLSLHLPHGAEFGGVTVLHPLLRSAPQGRGHQCPPIWPMHLRVKTHPMTVSGHPVRSLQRIRADVRAMHGYHVQASQGLLKMDTMENPYRLSSDLQKQLGERLGALEINRYPGERQEVLKNMLAGYAGAPAGSVVLLGNGSDELITLLALATAQPAQGGRATMLAPMPGFVMYPLSAKLQGLDFIGVDPDGRV